MLRLDAQFPVILLLLLLAKVAQAAIGPVGVLHITNEILAPDGFGRSVIAAGGGKPQGV